MDLDASLEELEDDRWGAPPTDATRLIATAYALRRRPVGTLGAEDLRLLISQNIGLRQLVPLALDHLESDPLAAGDMYEGALLKVVLSADRHFWSAHPALAARAQAVAEAVEEVPIHVRTAMRRFRDGVVSPRHRSS